MRALKRTYKDAPTVAFSLRLAPDELRHIRDRAARANTTPHAVIRQGVALVMALDQTEFRRLAATRALERLTAE